MRSLVELKNVSKTIAGHTILENVDLSIEQSAIITIKGPSGSGKTTLLALVAGFIKPDIGQVIRDRNLKVSFLFQDNFLENYLTVEENIAIYSPEVSAVEIIAIARQCGIDDKLSSYPSELSSGQKQRVGLSRALIQNPDIICLDEPTAHLDKDTEGAILDIIVKHSTPTYLIVSHSERVTSIGSVQLELSNGNLQIL